MCDPFLIVGVEKRGKVGFSTATLVDYHSIAAFAIWRNRGHFHFEAPAITDSDI